MLYQQNIIYGGLLILISEFLFASMGATVKAVSIELPNEMTVFFRNLFGLFILSLWLFRHGIGTIHTKVFHLHMVRAVFGVSAMYCFFYALSTLPLAEGLLLKMTAPFFMPFIAYFWLKESAPRLAILALPVGFIGIILILKPDGDLSWAGYIGLAGGMLAALAKVTVRRLGKSEPTFRVVFYFAAISTVISSVPMLWAWQPPSLKAWGLLFFMGILGTVAQLFLTRGYAIAKASQVAPLTYFSVVFGAVYGYIFWQEVLDMFFVVGAILIAIAGLLALQKKSMKQQFKENLET